MKSRSPSVHIAALLTLTLGACTREAPTTQPAPKGTAATQSPAATATPSDKPETTPQSITVPMKALSGSGQSGTATLTAVEGTRTKVQLELANSPKGPQPVHIHSGTCSALGGIEYPLTAVANGKSETTIDASLADLLAGEFAINVHKSGAEAGVYVSCGEIAT